MSRSCPVGNLRQGSAIRPMRDYPQPIDLRKIRVYPLAERESLSQVDRMLVDPGQKPRACDAEALHAIQECARKIEAARKAGASVMLLYGAHLVKNGAMRIVNRLVNLGWLTHLATNGAGTIHDWELAYLGLTEESVKKNVATGTFGTWEETGRVIPLALMAGALRSEGYGRSLGRFICCLLYTSPSPRDRQKSRMPSSA